MSAADERTKETAGAPSFFPVPGLPGHQVVTHGPYTSTVGREAAGPQFEVAPVFDPYTKEITGYGMTAKFTNPTDAEAYAEAKRKTIPASAKVIKDKQGKKWLYTGTAADPVTDKDPSHWKAQ